MKTYLEFIKENTSNEITVYHGGSGKITNDNLKGIIFTTSSKKDAMWYVVERGNWLTTLNIIIKKPLTCGSKNDFINKWIPILEDANINYEFKDLTDDSWDFYSSDIDKHSPYDGYSNYYDLVYIPHFVESAKKFGYDGIQGWDIIANYEIPIYISFYKENINVISSEYIPNADY